MRIIHRFRSYLFNLALGLVLTIAGLAGCGGESTQGPAAAGAIELLYPNGGETFQVGQTVVIKWRTDTLVTTDLNIHFSPDGGQNWILLNTDKSVNIGDDRWENFSWTIAPQYQLQTGENAPFVSAASSRCRIRISQYEGEESDTSQSDFTITD